jgi:hypothetical protein
MGKWFVIIAKRRLVGEVLIGSNKEVFDELKTMQGSF